MKRYEMTVSDDFVVVHGSLTIREAFDILSYFDKEGFTTVYQGDEKSTLYLLKNDDLREKKCERETIQDLNELLNEKDQALKELMLQKDHFQRRALEVEALMKVLLNEERKIRSDLTKENQELKRIKILEDLSEDPEVKKIISDQF